MPYLEGPFRSPPQVSPMSRVTTPVFGRFRFVGFAVLNFYGETGSRMVDDVEWSPSLDKATVIACGRRHGRDGDSSCARS